MRIESKIALCWIALFIAWLSLIISGHYFSGELGVKLAITGIIFAVVWFISGVSILLISLSRARTNQTFDPFSQSV